MSGQAETVALLLPSAKGTPIASPQLIRDRRDQGESDPTLSAWEVPCVTLPVGQAVGLLTHLQEDPAADATGVALAADLRFWSQAAKLALELLARQRFIPSLEGQPKGKSQVLRALWQPVLQDPNDAERVSILARAMPPACRALATSPPKRAPGDGKGSVPASVSPRALVESFINAAVDQTIRLWLAASRDGAHRRR
ncbi:MAG: hypothetical protein ACE5IZ_05620, partial [Dehalococcoidia bacterium]